MVSSYCHGSSTIVIPSSRVTQWYPFYSDPTNIWHCRFFSCTTLRKGDTLPHTNMTAQIWPVWFPLKSKQPHKSNTHCFLIVYSTVATSSLNGELRCFTIRQVQYLGKATIQVEGNRVYEEGWGNPSVVPSQVSGYSPYRLTTGTIGKPQVWRLIWYYSFLCSLVCQWQDHSSQTKSIRLFFSQQLFSAHRLNPTEL